MSDAEVATAAWTEAKVSALTQNSTDIISLLDAQGRLLYNSPATERINGFKPEELVGVNTFDFIHPDDQPTVTKVFRSVLATPGSVHTVQYRYRTRAGGWLWMEAVACNQLENPAVRGIVANTRDISARRRAEEERAQLAERSAPGQGTTVTVWFASSKVAVLAAPPQLAEWRGEGLVLVVDDEPQTARVACRLLQSLGFKTVTAVDGLDALERFAPLLGQLRLVLLDVVMPRLDGPRTFERLRELRPDLPVLFYSGYEAGAAEQALHEPRTAFLQKPFARSGLQAAVQSVLEGPATQRLP